MSHHYVTTTGVPSAREIVLHYVTVCLQVERYDVLLAQSVSGMRSLMGSGEMHIEAVNQVLDANEKAWNHRAKLIEARTAAYDALVMECGGDQKVIDAYVSTIAKEFGVDLELAQ